MSILVIGDVILDRRVEGELHRISPEAPVPVLKATALTSSLGGAANVAANLCAQLPGHTPVVLSYLPGDDVAADELQAGLMGLGIPCYTPPRRGQTSIKTRLTSGGQQLYRVDDEKFVAPDLAAVAEVIRAAFRDYKPSAVVLVDYDKGYPWSFAVPLLRELGTGDTVPVYVDAKPWHYHVFAGCTVLKPNLVEARAFASTCVHPALAIDQPGEVLGIVLGRFIRERLGCQHVIVTQGPAGASWVSAGVEQHYPVTPQVVCDPTGAGDTFMATLVSQLSQRADYPTAILAANTAAGLAVGRHGTAVISAADLREAQYRQQLPGSKLMTLHQAQGFMQRRPGQRLVFTNGCFDLLHPGHVHLLTEAKKYGDVLVVGCNADATVTRLKGPGRPRVPLTSRMQMLSLVPAVDVVVPFDEDTPETLIRALQPQVLVKGVEFRDAIVPGADYVAGRGGQVVFVPMLPGFSTTRLLHMPEGEHG